MALIAEFLYRGMVILTNFENTGVRELIETNGLYQLSEEPNNIRNEGSSCMDLIITDQANLFVSYGVHPALMNAVNINVSTRS